MPYNNNAIDSTTITPNLDLLDLLKQKILSQNPSPPPLSPEARGRISGSSTTTTFSLPFQVPLPSRRSFIGASSSSSSSSSSTSSSSSSSSFPPPSYSTSSSSSTSKNESISPSTLMPPPPPPSPIPPQHQPPSKNYKQTYSRNETPPPQPQPTSEDLRRNHIHNLEKENHSLRAKISVLSGEHETYKLRARQKLTAVLDKNSELCSTLQKSEIEFQAIYERLSEVFKDNHELGDRNALLSAENGKLQSLLSAKDQELNEMKERFAQEVKVFRGEIERLCKQKEEMAIFFTNKCNDFEKIRAHQDSMEEKVRCAVKNFMEMENEVENLKSKLEYAERVKNEYLEDIAILEKKKENQGKEKKVEVKKGATEIIKMRRESGVLMVKAGIKRSRGGQTSGAKQDELMEVKVEKSTSISTCSLAASSLICAVTGKRRGSKGLKRKPSSELQDEGCNKVGESNGYQPSTVELGFESMDQDKAQIKECPGDASPPEFEPEPAFNVAPHEFELITLSDDEFF